MPTEALPRYASILPGITRQEEQPAKTSTVIDRLAYWSAGKPIENCDICGRLGTIHGRVRTRVNEVLTRSTAVGDCRRWMLEEETLTPAQKEELIAIAAMGKEVPAANA